MYKLIKNIFNNEIKVVQKQEGDVLYSIPFAPDNTDYQQFKKDLAEGASLKDVEGTDMTAEQITTFLETLDK
jgi:N-acetylglucosamine-6-phosphate deacetylase